MGIIRPLLHGRSRFVSRATQRHWIDDGRTGTSEDIARRVCGGCPLGSLPLAISCAAGFPGRAPLVDGGGGRDDDANPHCLGRWLRTALARQRGPHPRTPLPAPPAGHRGRRARLDVAKHGAHLLRSVARRFRCRGRLTDHPAGASGDSPAQPAHLRRRRSGRLGAARRQAPGRAGPGRRLPESELGYHPPLRAP